MNSKSFNFTMRCFTNRMFLLIITLLCTVLTLSIAPAFAADVYVKIGGTRTSGKSTAGDWSNANCYPDIVTHGFPAMSAGDTMTIDDGTYTGTANLVRQDTATPPNGTSKTNMTVIRARNIPCQDGYSCSSALKVTWGEVTDNGTYSTSGLGLNGTVNSGAKSYIKFNGLRLYNVSLFTDWSYIYFKQCAFIGTMTGNSMSFSTDSPYLLMEDSVVMGSGRYQTLSHLDVDGSLHNVFRRVIARKDYSNASNQATMPMGIFTSYHTLDDAYLNCIAIDSDQPAYYANKSIEYGGGFFHGAGGTGLTIKGSLSLNVAMNAMTLGTHSGANTVTDFAAVKNAGGLSVSHGSANRATVYNTGTNLFSGWKTGQIASFSGNANDAFASVGGTFSVTNSIARTAQGYAGNGTYGTLTGSYWDYYSTGGNSGVTPSSSLITDPSTHGLLYPVRIETGSSLAAAGLGGGQIGANILKRIGHDGDFNGDTGWNTETTTDLWPWPYEDWVKAELAVMPATLGGLSMPSPTRGVASPTAKGLDGTSPLTLTRYVWESLGNQIPASIYNSAPDTTPPVVTAFTLPATATSLTVSINTFTVNDETALNATPYCVTTTNSSSGCSWLASAPTSVTFAASGTQTAYAWAKDATGNISAGVGGTTTISVVTDDTIAPTVTAFSVSTVETSGELTTEPISILSATDNVGVTGYIVTESSTRPLSTDSGWNSTAPVSYTTSSTGSITLYAWAKDAAGNVSNYLSATVASASGGNNYYVTPTGSDSNNCSAGSPCKTLAKPVTLAVAGDTIWLADGTYPGITIDGTSTTNFKGTAGSPITIKAQGSNAIIAGRDSSVTRGNLYLLNTSYIVVDGLKSTGATGSLGAGIAVRFSDHVTIKNCTVYNNSWGNIFTSNAANIIIDNNTVYGAGEDVGIYIANATTSHDQPTIRNNKSYSNATNGIHINGDGGYFTGAVIENNISYNNTGTGISMDGVQSSIVRNNLLYGNHATGISMFRIDATAGPAWNDVYNNTVDMPSDGRWCIRLSNSAGAISLKNNILYNRNSANGAISTTNSTDIANLTSDYNILVSAGTRIATPNDESSYYTFAQWQAQGKDTNSLSPNINSIFVSLGTDYHLAAASPAINSGQTLTSVVTDLTGTSRPQGAGYDIGAYELIVNSGVSNPKNLGIKAIIK